MELRYLHHSEILQYFSLSQNLVGTEHQSDFAFSLSTEPIIPLVFGCMFQNLLDEETVVSISILCHVPWLSCHFYRSEADHVQDQYDQYSLLLLLQDRKKKEMLLFRGRKTKTDNKWLDIYITLILCCRLLLLSSVQIAGSYLKVNKFRYNWIVK